MNQYPDSTRRRGRPLRNPSHDQRTPEEIAWWNSNVSDPNRANPKGLPLDTPVPDKLPDPWLLDSELLLRKFEQPRTRHADSDIQSRRYPGRHQDRPQRRLHSTKRSTLLVTSTPRRPTLIRQSSEHRREATRERNTARSENRSYQGMSCHQANLPTLRAGSLRSPSS
jgi:hypothetical protein